MYKLILFGAVLGMAASEQSSSTRIVFGGGSDIDDSRRITYAQPRVVYQRPIYNSAENTKPEYNFNWEVRDDYSGIDMGHQETRDGYNTQGSYRVLLPDSRIQTVTYYVDGDSGYVADVQYEGEARYDNGGSQGSGGYGVRPIVVRYRGGSRSNERYN
ncbi:unnamed protein product [Cyprideis torosa]|uniref:Uncharacterized protein n=1 Tax=Cyprideis torosa TaxID=163714 RepID=A0A7R8WN49_9CRUS|nr:unnamed protein product [Cyprideis torosa]CAG0900203.1 unnamed protein product [Cyprideis torosa]